VNALSWGFLAFGLCCLVCLFFIKRWRKRVFRQLANEIRPAWRQLDNAHQGVALLQMEMSLASRWPYTWMREKHRDRETRKVSREFLDYLDNT
jgi:hypothetical protein